MCEESVEALVEKLRGGRNALTPDMIARFEALGSACVPQLTAMAGCEDLLAAPEPEGWGPIHAIRLLARLQAKEAVPTLVAILEGAEGDDQASAEAARALFNVGPEALPAVAEFLGQTENPHGRGLAFEIISNLALDYRHDGAFEEARLALEGLLLQSDDPDLRAIVVQVLGDLASPESAEPLLGAVRRPGLTQREYEAIRDVLEGLGVGCPDLYFDSYGKGYPLDEEKLPLCPVCGTHLIIQDSGDLMHSETACALQSGSEPVG